MPPDIRPSLIKRWTFCNMCNNLSACCANDDEAGTDGTQKTEKVPNPATTRSRTLSYLIYSPDPKPQTALYPPELSKPCVSSWPEIIPMAP